MKRLATRETLSDILKNALQNVQDRPLPIKFPAQGIKVSKWHNVAVLPEYNSFELQRAIAAKDYKTSWKIYKLKTRDWDEFHPDDHTSILEQLVDFGPSHSAASHASKVVYNMTQLDIKLDARDYYCLMVIHYRNRNDCARVLEFFEKAKESNNCTYRMYSLAIKSVGDAKNIAKAIEIYDQLVSTDKLAQFDTECRAALMEALANSGNFQFTRELFNDYCSFVRHSPLKSGTDAQVFNAMIKSFSIQQEFKKALDLMNDFRVDLWTFDALMQGQTNFEGAMDVYKLAIDYCVTETSKQNRETVGYRDYAFPPFSDSLLELPTKTTSRCSKIYPKLNTYLLLMDILIKDPQLKESYKYILPIFHFVFQSCSGSLRNDIYEKVIESLVKCSKTADATIWYDFLIAAKRPPSFYISRLLNKV